MLMEMVQQVLEKSKTGKNQFLYLGKSQLAIGDILAVEKKIRESKTIQLMEGPIQFEFGIKSFVPLDWDYFSSFTHYSVEARFTELGPRSIERLVAFIKNLKGLRETNIGGSIFYNAKGVKPSKLNPSEILIYPYKGKIRVSFKLQKNSPYTKYCDGVVIKGNKNDEFYDFVRKLSGNSFPESTTNSLILEPSEFEYGFIQKAYDYLGEKITSISWRVGLFGNRDEILPRLQDLFEEKPDADWCKASLTAAFKSPLALEELRKVIDHKTNFIIPMGNIVLNKGQKNASAFVVAVRVMETGYQFVAICEQPLHEGLFHKSANTTPEMQSYLDIMGIDTIKATPFKKVLEEIHPK